MPPLKYCDCEVGATSVPTLATIAACPALNTLASADMVGCNPYTLASPAIVFGQERSLEQQHLTWEAWVKPGLVDTTSRRVMANEEPGGGTLLAARRDGIVFARYLNPGDY